jgi:hypothetical protein
MTFKILNEDDIVNTRTLLHEAIPLTGTIISGTYGGDDIELGSEGNIKNFSHGMFQSVYDYPYLSSSANHILDITVGLSTTGELQPLCTTTVSQASKKKNMYNQMAQVLMGFDATGSVMPFDEDGDILAGGKKIKEAFIIPFSRLLTKDEIKKETFTMELGIDARYNKMDQRTILIQDIAASTEYRVNSPVGEYGILYATASSPNQYLDTATGRVHTASINGDKYWYAGLIYYQAGVVVLTASILQTTSSGGGYLDGQEAYADLEFAGIGGDHPRAVLTGSSISGSANFLRHRIMNVQFNNTTELNSTVYFCRANHNQFNYSSNPTYTSNSKIRVKNNTTDDPVAYITTIGLYNDNNELLAVAKLSEPLQKKPSNEFTFRVRLDY